MNYLQSISNQLKGAKNPIHADKVLSAFSDIHSYCSQLPDREHSFAISQNAHDITYILLNINVDTDSLIAGIILELYENQIISQKFVQEKYGISVHKILMAVSALDRIPISNRTQPATIRKMMIAMAKDVRVVIIKLAKRLLEMRSSKYMNDETPKQLSRETLSVFTPIAHRLGLGKIKWELEDLSFYHLQPEKYREIVSMIRSKRREREAYIERVNKRIQEELVKKKISGEVSGRAKHLYSIYKKIYEKGKSFDKIYDLIAFRIIVNSKKECYNVLSLLHSLWEPIEGRFKDYISKPRENGYQSIHTSLVGPEKKILEVQIRTQSMHKVAEEGIAAHWKYKENVSEEKQENLYSFLKEMLTWNIEREDSQISKVTRDLFHEEVFVFTPQGDVLELPAGSSPLDFAFRIHTQLAFKCQGAKVNNKLVPLHTRLQNGDMVELLTSAQPKGPGKNWLTFVKTESAKSKIRKWFKEKQFEEKSKEGKATFEKALTKNNLKFNKIEDSKILQEFLRKNTYLNIEDFFFQVGLGKVNLHSLVNRLKLQNSDLKKSISIPKNTASRRTPNSQQILVEELTEVMIHLAKCCDPELGDEIAGYITLTNGVSIHKSTCMNFQHLQKKNPSRTVSAKWMHE
ncbi:MAG: RelA/SpoT family protein [Spirochaetota bacterium]